MSSLTRCSKCSARRVSLINENRKISKHISLFLDEKHLLNFQIVALSITWLLLHIRGIQCSCLSEVINNILYYLAPIVANGIIF